MRPKSSLMPPFNSLLGRNKFPVPMRRELPRKVLLSLCYLGPFPRLETQIGANSLFISLLAGNFNRDEFAPDSLLQRRVMQTISSSATQPRLSRPANDNSKSASSSTARILAVLIEQNY